MSSEPSGARLRAFLHRLLFAPIDERGSSFVRAFRYLAVGGVAWLVDYGMLMVLAKIIGAPLLLAATGGFIAGLAVNYAISLTWVFGLRSFGPTTFTVFLVTGVIGLGLNDLLLLLLNETWGIDLTISKIITTVMVLAWNYIGRLVSLRGIESWRQRRASSVGPEKP